MRLYLLLLCLLGPACASDAPTRALPEPWSEVEVPLGSGVVESISAEEVHIRYAQRSRKDLLDAYRRALMDDGWVAAAPSDIPGFSTLSFTKGGETLEILVSGRGQRADVLLTR